MQFHRKYLNRFGKIIALLLLAIGSIYFVAFAQQKVAVVQGIVYVEMTGNNKFDVDVDRVVPDAEVLYVDLLGQGGGITYANDDGLYQIPNATKTWYHVQTVCGEGVSINTVNGEIGKDIPYTPCLYGHTNPPNVNEVLARYGMIYGSPLYTSDIDDFISHRAMLPIIRK